MSEQSETKTVFLSYANYNRHFVDRLSADLERSGINIWRDIDDLKPGTPDWEAAIRRAVCVSDFVVLVASKESQKSPFVRSELLVAEEGCDSPIPILPVWAVGEKWIECIPLGLSSYQRIDCRNEKYTLGLGELLHTITGEKTIVVPESSHPDKPPELDNQEEKNRQRLLTQVKRAWIQGVLKNSVFKAVMMELNITAREDLVYPWLKELGVANHPNYQLPQGTSITDIFDRAKGQVILITGEPGSGKTTTLLELAEDLIERAENNATASMPVVLKLSSWSPQYTIEEWVVFELTTKYGGVPAKIGQKWLSEQKLVLLLDGLDEVAPRHRNNCVDAINQFSATYTSTPIVVCCRIKEFEEMEAQLSICDAIHIQPLSLSQATEYLTKLGPELDGIRVALQNDAELQELARTPLLLSIIALTYQGVPAEHLQTLRSSENRKSLLFDTYIESMLGRQIKGKNYSSAQIIKWLKWIAQRIEERNETVFQIERLQPNLLSSNQREVYAIISRLPLLLVGILLLLSIQLTFGGVALGLAVGISSGVLGWVILRLFKGQTNSLDKIEAAPPAFGGLMGGFWGAIVGVGSNWGDGFSAIVSNGYGTFLVSIIIGAASAIIIDRVLIKRERTIKPIEKLSWSWDNAKEAISQLKWMIGLSFILAILLLVAIRAVTGILGGLGVAFSTIGFVFGGVLLVGGLSNDTLEAKTIPNQSIWQSIRNALVAGGMYGILFGIVAMVGGIAATDITTGVNIGLLAGFVLGVGAGVIYGGTSSAKHLMLRLMLYTEGVIPLNYAEFLDHCVRRVLLQRVGGSYIFIHKMLQEHFVNVDAEKILANLQNTRS